VVSSVTLLPSDGAGEEREAAAAQFAAGLCGIAVGAALLDGLLRVLVHAVLLIAVLQQDVLV
jgi:hypothetical protein